MEQIVLVGAGSAQFTRGLVADLLSRKTECSLALVDTDPHALRVAEALVRKMASSRGRRLELRATTERREVLPGASVVIATIGVGGRRAWEADVLIARRFGIFQPVGDTVLPGGASRSLRMIPAMVAIARDVKELAPNALFFNYGNPMGPVCRAVRRATGTDMVGLCHGVNYTAHYIAEQLSLSPEALTYEAAGVNHLTWFTRVATAGRDLMPALKERALEKEDEFRRSGEAPHNLFTWQCVRRFDAFPAVLDRHVTEFFPALFAREGAYYGKTLGREAFSFENTIARGDRIFAEMERDALGPDPLAPDYCERIEGEHEQVLDILASLRGGPAGVFSVNLPNSGQIPDLPADSIVESPARIDADGIAPTAQAPLGAALAGPLMRKLEWDELVVEAALQGNRKSFVQALLIEGALPSVDSAEHLADELLAAQRPFLPAFA